MHRPIIQIIFGGIHEERFITKEQVRLIRKIIDDDAFATMITDMIEENDSTI